MVALPEITDGQLDLVETTLIHVMMLYIFHGYHYVPVVQSSQYLLKAFARDRKMGSLFSKKFPWFPSLGDVIEPRGLIRDCRALLVANLYIWN